MKFKDIDFDAMEDQAQANWLAAARYYFNALGLTLRAAAELMDGIITYGHIADLLHGEEVDQPRKGVLVAVAQTFAHLSLEEFREAGAMLRSGRKLPLSWRPRVRIHKKILPKLVNGSLVLADDAWEMPMMAAGKRLPQKATLASYVVRDDGLMPVAPAGTAVIVDTSSVQPKINRCYLVAKGGALLVRRVFSLGKNKGYAFRQFDSRVLKGDYTLGQDDVQVLGEIVWWPPQEDVVEGKEQPEAGSRSRYSSQEDLERYKEKQRANLIARHQKTKAESEKVEQD